MVGGARDADPVGPLGEVRDPPSAVPGSPAAAPQRGGRLGAAGRPPRALIFSVTLTGVMVNTLVAPAIPDVLDGLGVGRGRAGLLLASATLPGIVLAPVVGLLADRFGRREVLAPCLALFGVAGGLGGLAPDFGFLLLARFVQGIGSAALINLAVVIIADHWEDPERARLIGQNSAVLTVALAVLPTVGGALADLGGWRWVFAPYWLGLVTAGVVWVALPSSPTRDVRFAAQISDALLVLRVRRVRMAIGTGVVVFVIIFGLLLTLLPLHLDEAFGLGATSRGLVFAAPALASTVAALLLGRLTARFGARRLVVTASVVFTASILVIGGAPSLVVLVAGALLYGVGEGLAIPSLQAIVAGAAPASSRGAVFAVWVGGVRAGQTAGPVMAGGLAAVVGIPWTFVAGAILVAGLLAVQLATREPG